MGFWVGLGKLERSVGKGDAQMGRQEWSEWDFGKAGRSFGRGMTSFLQRECQECAECFFGWIW